MTCLLNFIVALFSPKGRSDIIHCQFNDMQWVTSKEKFEKNINSDNNWMLRGQEWVRAISYFFKISLAFGEKCLRFVGKYLSFYLKIVCSNLVVFM